MERGIDQEILRKGLICWMRSDATCQATIKDYKLGLEIGYLLQNHQQGNSSYI